jgi:hypothetical protein
MYPAHSAWPTFYMYFALLENRFTLSASAKIFIREAYDCLGYNNFCQFARQYCQILRLLEKNPALWEDWYLLRLPMTGKDYILRGSIKKAFHHFQNKDLPYSFLYLLDDY